MLNETFSVIFKHCGLSRKWTRRKLRYISFIRMLKYQENVQDCNAAKAENHFISCSSLMEINVQTINAINWRVGTTTSVTMQSPSGNWPIPDFKECTLNLVEWKNGLFKNYWHQLNFVSIWRKKIWKFCSWKKKSWKSSVFSLLDCWQL